MIPLLETFSNRLVHFAAKSERRQDPEVDGVRTPELFGSTEIGPILPTKSGAAGRRRVPTRHSLHYSL